MHLPFDFETAARIPAAVFGTVEVLALMLLARRLTAARSTSLLVAGLFLAVAPFAVRYAQENRYYTTFSALQLVTWWLVIRAIDRRTTGAFVWWGLALGALVLAHPFAPLVVLAQLSRIAALLRPARAAPGRARRRSAGAGSWWDPRGRSGRRTVDRLGAVPLDPGCPGRGAATS